MTKILLVEDDKSLREIYGVRLLAEGYDIVTASDGEEALAIAIKEHPVLIIADVMMPKISGFDMLDILKSTTETRNIKVIVMTALSSEEQRARGERIGADRYLVKSQVGIEDVVKTVHDVLGDKPAVPAPVPQPMPQPPTMYQAAAAPVAPQPVMQPAPAPAPQPTQQPYTPPVQQPYTPPTPPAHYTMPAAVSPAPARPAAKQRIIQPINDPSQKVDINELLDRELAKEAGINGGAVPQVSTTAQEQQIVNEQINAVGVTSSAQPEPTVAPEQPQPQAPVTPQQFIQTPVSPPQAPVDRTNIGQTPVRPDITPPVR